VPINVEVEQLWLEADLSFLRISEVVPPVTHRPSEHSQVQLYLYLYLAISGHWVTLMYEAMCSIKIHPVHILPNVTSS